MIRSEKKFRTTQELEYLFFFKNSTLGYMTKTLNHIIFFFLHQNQNIFFSNIGNQNIFSLNGRSLNRVIVLNANILAISWQSVLLVEETRVPEENNRQAAND